jgi:ribosomal protein S18 acetylase RimI-like enzyme
MDVSVQRDALARVAAYLQSDKAGSERIGPFLAGFTPGTTSPWLNYAVPVPDARPTPAEVAALVAAFTGRGLLPRLEYLPGTAPEVEPALLAAGFAVEGRPPVLACTPAGRRDRPPPERIAFALAIEADLPDVLAVQHEAYGEPAPPNAADLARAVRHLERGGLTGLARDTARDSAAEGRGGTARDGGGAGRGGGKPDGDVVAGGQLLRPVDGVAELVGVAVAASHRRRGIATGLAAYLTRTAHERGADLVWLEPAGPQEQLVYERAGYHPVGAKLYLSRPSP